MTPEILALVLFLASLGLPALIVGTAAVFGVDIKRLAPVNWLFWALGAGNLVSSAVLLGPTSESARTYQIAYGIIVALLVVPRLFRFRAPVLTDAAEESQPLSRGDESTEVRGRPGACCPRLDSESGAKLPKRTSGRSGQLGWIFFVANKYTWDLSISASGDSGGVLAQARAMGTFSGWNQLTESRLNAFAEVQGAVTCRRLAGACVARGSGGQMKHDSGDFEAAVTIDVIPGQSPDEVQLEVQLVAALEGQLAISTINVGGSAGASGGGASGNVRADTVINIANTALDLLDATQRYNYICEPCDAESPTAPTGVETTPGGPGTAPGGAGPSTAGGNGGTPVPRSCKVDGELVKIKGDGFKPSANFQLLSAEFSATFNGVGGTETATPNFRLPADTNGELGGLPSGDFAEITVPAACDQDVVIAVRVTGSLDGRNYTKSDRKRIRCGKEDILIFHYDLDEIYPGSQFDLHVSVKSKCG